MDDTQNPSAQYESDHDQSGSDHSDSDPAHSDDNHDQYEDAHHSSDPGRVTSPMQEFSMGQVTTGFVVLLVGLVVVFGLPLLL